MESDKAPTRKFKCYPIGYFHIDIAQIQPGLRFDVSAAYSGVVYGTAGTAVAPSADIAGLLLAIRLALTPHSVWT